MGVVGEDQVAHVGLRLVLRLWLRVMVLHLWEDVALLHLPRDQRCRVDLCCI